MAVLFFRVEWETRCDLNPELSCGEAQFTPISDSIPLSALHRQLEDLTSEWDRNKTGRLKARLLPVLNRAEQGLRERLGELSPLGASVYLFRYYRELEQGLSFTRMEEAEDYYRLSMLEALYRASEAIKENGGSTVISQSLLDTSVPLPEQTPGGSHRYRFAEAYQ